ncbi:MAG: hypothetical protein E7409_02425 [Ruminococcaceae bacterium]|nr:hypothetical protein [Oscillospiraceae bacterium]
MNAYKNTYCNPMKVENYPMGYEAPDHRSLADPSVIYYEGKWYMYPSYGMAYVSEDFITWKHHPIQPVDIGYAPTVVVHKGKIYLCANGDSAMLYVADNPLGPFEQVGHMCYPNGEKVDGPDKMLFSDDDGRLYLYFTQNFTDKESGIAIYGVELDGDNPTKALTDPIHLIGFHPEHTWECFGARSQHKGLGWIEGAWMVKINGRYYLTYSGSGTAFGTYATGAYYSDEGPLSGFVYQKRNPICSRNYGLTRGGGHGSIVEGPNGTYWSFYTIPISYSFKFERRIGMDPIEVDQNGEIMMVTNTDTPQWAPGAVADPYHNGATDLVPLTINMPVYASGSAPGRDPLYAVDENLQSWWQPAAEDDEKSLTVDLRGSYLASAMRIIWRDVNINIAEGRCPGAFQYKVEVSTDEKNWVTVVDKTANTTDYAVDYETFETVPANFVRLTVTGTPEGIEAGVIDFTVFGKYPQE